MQEKSLSHFPTHKPQPLGFRVRRNLVIQGLQRLHLIILSPRKRRLRSFFLNFPSPLKAPAWSLAHNPQLPLVFNSLRHNVFDQ